MYLIKNIIEKVVIILINGSTIKNRFFFSEREVIEIKNPMNVKINVNDMMWLWTVCKSSLIVLP